MLDKSSKLPQERLINLFDILDDWLDAPQIAAPKLVTLNARTESQLTPSLLQAYLTTQAEKMGAMMPEMLANQLLFMALAGANEKVNARNLNSLSHAKLAANALIAAQTQQEFRIAKSSAYAIAASFVAIFVVAGSLLIFNKPNNTTGLMASNQPIIAPTNTKTMPTTPQAVNQIATAEQTTALIAQINLMRKGNCQLIEALQLPDSYKKVYFENIVLGQISTNIQDQKMVHSLLEKIRCNYTPMLMANSK